MTSRRRETKGIDRRTDTRRTDTRTGVYKKDITIKAARTEKRTET